MIVKRIFLVALLLLTLKLYAGTQNIVVVVEGIETAVGNIIVTVFADAADFPKDGSEYRKVTVPAKTESVEIAFDKMKLGEYAFAVLHDKNANGKCDKKLLGIPTEPFGFSNNVRPKLKVPNFDQVKVNINDGMVVKIRLISF